MIPAILYNLEVWTNWRRKYWESLEQIQAESLKSMLRLPKSTPYWGMLNELGVWPLKERIIYKRLMLYQQIIHYNDDRLCKKVVEEQKRMAYEGCWYSELEQEAKKTHD